MMKIPYSARGTGALAAAVLAGVALAAACGKAPEEDPCAPNGTASGETCQCNAGFVPQGKTCIPVAAGTDGGTDAGVDAGVTCDVLPSLGIPAPTNVEADGNFDADAGVMDWVRYFADVNADPEPDYVQLELYAGYGIFEVAGLATGTFLLEGDELQYRDCGACVLLKTDFNPGTGSTQTYMSTGGSITIDSFTDRITGTLNDVSFRRVDIDPNTAISTPTAGNCITHIASLAFDGAIVFPA